MPKRIIIIGGGPAGYVGAIRAAQLGAEVVKCEHCAEKPAKRPAAGPLSSLSPLRGE